MTTYGWIITITLSVLALLFGYRFIKDFIWNKRLGNFHTHQKIHIPKVPLLYWMKRGYGLVLSSFAAVTIVACGAFSLPIREPNVYLTANKVGSQEKLVSLINDINRNYNPETDFAVPGNPEQIGDEANEDQRDFIDTNMQVDGVIEADIVKTDGYSIYYASRYHNKVRVIDIENDGSLELRQEIDLGNLYTDSLYITDTKLIVIGYIYTYFYMMPDLEGNARDYYGGYTSFTGAVYIYDRETLELDYKLETDTNFYQHRLIGDALYLLANKGLYTNDLVPSFSETIDGETTNIELDYDSIYYFDGMPAYSMTVITVIDLASYEMSSEAFLGQVHQIYANQNAIYTTATVYEYETNDDFVWWGGQAYTFIVKYHIDPEEKSFSYEAYAKVKGYIESQYWMDEYDDYFRIVTTAWGQNIVNRLYILETNKETQTLDQVGLIEDGIGKEGLNERVYAVVFNKTRVNVVTYENMDPLYTIDMSDPENPFILPNPIEEEGYNTYLHVWNEDHYLIGVGYDANFQLKLGAYDTSENNPNPGEPLVNYYLVEESEDGIYQYSYSEVLYNPKAIMVDVERGIFGFPVNTYKYTYNELLGYHDFAYLSLYYIFYIDFSSENPEDVISEPIIIEQDELMYYAGIDRGVYIEFEDFTMVYTLSFAQIVSYNLTTQMITSVYTFPGMDTYNPYYYDEEDGYSDDDSEPQTDIVPGDEVIPPDEADAPPANG